MTVNIFSLETAEEKRKKTELANGGTTCEPAESCLVRLEAGGLAGKGENVFLGLEHQKGYPAAARTREDPSARLFAGQPNKLNGYGSCIGYQEKAVDNYLSPESGNGANPSEVTISDIIGSFGWYQFLILLFSGLRECSVGYDAVVMSVILRPLNNFYCADSLEPGFTLNSYADNSKQFNKSHQCFQNLNGHMLTHPATGEPIKCHSWVFEEAEGESKSLVAEWLLVCHRQWLVAFIESAYFLGLVMGNLIWGYCADKFGRRRAYITAHTINLLFGMLSIFAPQLWMFAVCRFFSALGAVSYNIIYSIQVELIGTKHRSYSTLLNHLGWGMGVILVPLAHRCLADYRYMLSVAPLISLLMYPWALSFLPESSRWLMAHERFGEARYELIKAAKFNKKNISPLLEKRISMLRIKIKNDLARLAENSSFSNKHPYRLLFTNPILIRDTFILSYVSFMGHMFYYLLTINFGYIENLSLDANFITSGAGEWLSVVVGAVLLKLTSRKNCLSLFLLLMASSFLFQALIDLELAAWLGTELVVSLNNGIGTISSMLVVFIALIINQEVFPTIIRQTGSSLVNTISESGSTMAPMLIQVSRHIGSAYADVLWAIMSLLGIVCVQFLTKTDDMELADS